MNINTKAFVSMTDANQNFSKVPQVVDKYGMAIILKKNKPRYMLVNFDAYETIIEYRAKLIGETVDNIIEENMPSLKELAK